MIDATSNQPLPRWVRVHSAAAKLEQARALAERVAGKKVHKLLREPEAFRFDWKAKKLADEHRDLVCPAWRTIVRSPEQPFPRRAVAARFLCDQRDDAGLDFFLSVLPTANAAQRLELMSEAIRVFDNDWARRRRDEFAPIFLGLMKPATVRMACVACRYLKITAAGEKARELWDKKIRLIDRDILAETLPQDAKTLAAMTILEQELNQPKLSMDDRSHLLQCLIPFADSPQPEVVEEVFRLVEKHFPWTSKELTLEGEGASSQWVPMISRLPERAGRSALPLLERFLRSKLNSKYRREALEALVKLLGRESLPYLKESLESPRLQGDAIGMIRRVFEGTGDATALALVQSLAGAAEKKSLRKKIDHAIADIRKPAKNATTLPDPVWRRLIDLGLMEPVSDEAMARSQPNSDPDHAFHMMLGGGRAAWFDGEAAFIPPDHPEIVRHFRDASGGLFTPESIVQRVRGERASVQFIFGERLYRFRCRDLGDYYDNRRTLWVVNRALQDAGLIERFVEVDTGDQMVCCIFGRPENIRQAATEFRWKIYPQ